MKNKFLSILAAVVLLVSFSLVAAVPAAAEVSAAAVTLDVLPSTLGNVGNGTAEWSTEQQHTGSYSVKLVMPAPRTANDAAIVAGPSVDKLDTFANDGFGVYFYKPTAVDLTPFFVLEFDLTGDGTMDTWLVNAHTDPKGPEASWVLGMASQETQIWDGAAWAAGVGGWAVVTTSGYTITPTGTDEGSDNYWDLSEWAAGTYDTTAFGDAVVANVKVEYGFSSSTTGGEIVYVDDCTISGTTYYGLIQDAIDAAASGDTILVYDGTYAEDLVVNGKTDLTIKSANGAASTFIVGQDGVAIDVIGGANNLTFGGADAGFTVSGTSGATTTFLFEIAGGETGVTVEGNVFDATGDPSQAVSVGAAGATGLTINDNSFTLDAGDVAVDLWGPITNLVVDSNVITGPADGDAGSVTFTDGIAVTGATISNNAITGATSQIQLGAGLVNGITYNRNTFSETQGAILVLETTDPDPEAVVLSNLKVTQNQFAASSLDSFGFMILTGVEAADIDYSTVAVNFNSFEIGPGNTFAVVSNLAEVGEGEDVPDLNAECNWWNDINGPTGGISGGAGDDISADVIYSPWWGADYLTGSAPAIVPAEHPWEWRVDTSGPNPPGAIQEAVDVAGPGDTILVYQGTYNEFVNVWQPLTIQSLDGAAVTIIHPLPPEVEIAGEFPTQAVLITAGNVVFDGFTVEVDGDDWAGTPDSGIVASGQGATNLQIVNNVVTVDNVVEAWGIAVYGYAGTVEIDNNTVSLGASQESIYRGHGIVAGGNETVLITGNDVTVLAHWLAEGIYAEENYIVKVLGNTVLADVAQGELEPEGDVWSDGIDIFGAYKAQVQDNSVTANLDADFGWASGIYVDYVERSEVGGAGNTVAVNLNTAGGGAGAGIYVESGHLANILDNIVDFNANVGWTDDWADGIDVIDVQIADVGNNQVTVNTLSTGEVVEDSAAALPERIAQRTEQKAQAKAQILGGLVGGAGENSAWGEAYGIWSDWTEYLSIHDNTVAADADAVAVVAEEGYAESDAYAYSSGIEVWESYLPEIKNNQVVATADVNPDATATGSEAYGSGSAYAYGIIVGSYWYDGAPASTTNSESSGAIISVNSVNAAATATVSVASGASAAVAEGSLLAQLQSELNNLYSVADKTLAEESEKVKVPQPISAYAGGAGGAIGIGILTDSVWAPQISNNSPVAGSGVVNAAVTASSTAVAPEEAGAAGEGIGIGIGIYVYDSPGADIEGNGANGTVSGTGTAHITVLAEENLTESAESLGGGAGIGIGIHATFEMVRVVGNNVFGNGSADTTVTSLEAIPYYGAYTIGGSLSLGMGISVGGTLMTETTVVLPPQIFIQGNQVNAVAGADAAIDAQSVSSEDPLAMGGAAGIAVGIYTQYGWGYILDNTPVMANATATADIGAIDEQLLQDAAGMGGSLSLGLGIVNMFGYQFQIQGNAALGTGWAGSTVIAQDTVPLNAAEAYSAAAGIGSGLTLLDSYAEVNWNQLSGAGHAAVEASADATFAYAEEMSFGLSAGALNLGGQSLINYNNLLTEYTTGIYVGQVPYEYTIPYQTGEQLYFGLLDLGYANARYNWWGDPSGPSGIGLGTGEQLGSGSYMPMESATPYYGTPYSWWLSHPIADLLTDNVGYYGFQEAVLSGWNTLSTPVALENSSWDALVAMGNGLDYAIAYYYDPTQAFPWVQVTSGFELRPLEGIYIKANSTDVVFFNTSGDPYAPARDLTQGQSWYLIGPTPYDQAFPFTPAMRVDRALVSLEVTPAGTRGCNQVVSPMLGGQEPWIFVPGMGLGKPQMFGGSAYWAFMENPDTLAGYVFTPLPIWLPLWPAEYSES